MSEQIPRRGDSRTSGNDGVTRQERDRSDVIASYQSEFHEWLRVAGTVQTISGRDDAQAC